jgi:hypothetical protein
MFGLGLPLLCAALFYYVAEYEHMTGWKWAAASLAVSFGISFLLPGFIGTFVGQLGLFGVLWWQNSKRLDELNVDRAARNEQDRRSRQERVRQAHEQADGEKGKPQ